MFENNVLLKNGYRHFPPDTIPTKGSVKWIFPVPESDAVGTIDLDNAITFIKFRDGKTTPKYKIIAKNFSKMVSGNFDYRFSPNFADDMIVYSKTRVAVICDLKTGEAFHAGFKLTMDDYMLGIRFLDPQNKRFIVVKSIEAGGGLDDPWVDNLHLAMLDGKRLVDLGEVMPRFEENQWISQDFPAYNWWVIHDRKLIAYDGNNSKKMLCFDGLNATTHPFAEIFNRNIGNFRSLRDMAIHPELPFGVIVEKVLYPDRNTLSAMSAEARLNLGIHTLFLVRWDTNDHDEQFTAVRLKLLLLSSHLGIKIMGLAYPSFSPDGKWLVVGCFQYNMFKSPYFIAIPVDTKNPNFLDMEKLVVLSSGERMTSTAWTTNPTAFVVANGSKSLKRWDLEKLPKARVVIDTIGGK